MIKENAQQRHDKKQIEFRDIISTDPFRKSHTQKEKNNYIVFVRPAEIEDQIRIEKNEKQKKQIKHQDQKS